MAEDQKLPLSREEAEAIFAATKDPSTKDFSHTQSMYAIKDPRKSLEFYSKVLGMTLLSQEHLVDCKVSCYFVGYVPKESIPKDSRERTKWSLTYKTTLQLTHNWGAESDPEPSFYKPKNSDGLGYADIGIHVPDVNKACKRFEELGVEFIKKPDEERLKGVAFIKDPDGYWIEIFSMQSIETNV